MIARLCDGRWLIERCKSAIGLRSIVQSRNLYVSSPGKASFPFFVCQTKKGRKKIHRLIKIAKNQAFSLKFRSETSDLCRNSLCLPEFLNG